MAHGLNSVIKRAVQCKSEGKTGVGSRRIFSPQFKLQVLDSYRNDADCKGNQRATARKYGIHRRQIQKWLQVEGTLRCGVSGRNHQPSTTGQATVKSEVSLNGHRQRDDETRSASLASEARVPAMEPPAGWSAQQAAPISVPPDPATPMDLSLKRPPHSSNPAVVCLATAGPSPRQPDVWDLSTKANKRKAEEDNAPSKSVKLFKPYLDNISDKESPPAKGSTSYITSLPSSPQGIYCCQTSPELYFLNNNNNNNFCCDTMKSPEYHPAYTFQELQRTSFYPYGYYPEYHPDVSPTYHIYEEPVVPAELKCPYTLDYKVSAIDCYHPDALCKGNPRAVATKYHILRREESKWIKEELQGVLLKDEHTVR